MSISQFAIFLLSLFLLQSCESTYNYNDTLRRELESGVIQNHIILDIDFGMKKDHFYDYCWKLNNEQKAEQGPNNRTVKVEIHELEKRAYMLFYPNFINDEIVEMPILFGYEDWSPWNRESYSSKLILKVRELVNNWYDIDLQLVRDTTGYPGYVNIQGNRKLTLIVQNDQHVKLLVTDMTKVEDPFGPLIYKRT